MLQESILTFIPPIWVCRLRQTLYLEPFLPDHIVCFCFNTGYHVNSRHPVVCLMFSRSQKRTPIPPSSSSALSLIATQDPPVLKRQDYSDPQPSSALRNALLPLHCPWRSGRSRAEGTVPPLRIPGQSRCRTL